MAIQQTKITEDELKELTDFQQSINVITYQLGQIALKRLNLEQEEEVLESQYTKLLQVEKQLGDKLKEKYGDSQIDLKTGEIIQS
tara:strand:+ start:1210 stop:1464 length:255 start_codon:yes stop_codon:yes gene_type:complete